MHERFSALIRAHYVYIISTQCHFVILGHRCNCIYSQRFSSSTRAHYPVCRPCHPGLAIAADTLAHVDDDNCHQVMTIMLSTDDI